MGDIIINSNYIICRKEGVTLLLNPAPFKKMEKSVLDSCAYLTLNETEARLLLGLAPDDPSHNEEIAKKLLACRVNNVIMTMAAMVQ